MVTGLVLAGYIVVFAAGVFVGGHNAAAAETARGKLAAWARRAAAWVRARLGGGQ